MEDLEALVDNFSLESFIPIHLRDRFFITGSKILSTITDISTKSAITVDDGSASKVTESAIKTLPSETSNESTGKSVTTTSMEANIDLRSTIQLTSATTSTKTEITNVILSSTKSFTIGTGTSQISETARFLTSTVPLVKLN
ncbi:hypothetical protein SNEBB_005245 [Seison nebaliae]|nr:hypothetical protein SNEBB_005245 [Seison nebaliae]